MDKIRRHLSVANVVSVIALFVALSGVTYAASDAKNSVKTMSIARGAVTTPKLKNNAVTTAKLRNGAVNGVKLREQAVTTNKLAPGAVRSGNLGGGVVTTPKLKNGAVDASKLANNAVTSGKLAANAVTTGKVADGSVTGAKLAPSFLAQLLKDVSYETKASANDTVSPKTAEAVCPAGKVAIGGGARVVLDTAVDVALIGSEPSPPNAQGNRVGWTATAKEIDGDDPGNWSVEAYVVCAAL